VTDRLLPDTHIALWLDNGDDRLNRATRDLIDAIWRTGDNACFSAVSAWEIALLVDAGRFRLDVAVEDWVGRFIALPGVTAVPLSHRAGFIRLQKIVQNSAIDEAPVSSKRPLRNGGR
jgi:PIN domain nuclease of toxin-antitoxin system